jgi:hypothetical protein
MHVRFYPLRDGIYDEGLDLGAIQTGGSHDLRAQDRGHQLHKTARQSMTWGRLPTPVRRAQEIQRR